MLFLNRTCAHFIRSFLLLLLPFFSHAQEILKGKVVEASTGNAIPYATIGLVKQNTGTNANERGEFTISCQQPDLDSLIISCVGYVTNRAPVKDFKNRTVITLVFNIKHLKPVVIKNKWTSVEVGNYKNNSQEYCRTTSGYQSQIAIKMIAPCANTLLQSVQVRTSKYLGKTSIFRIHVFDIDSITQGPGEELTDTAVQVICKRGDVKIDMLPYQVWLPGKEFFVSMEWLFIPFNEYHFNAKYEGRDSTFLHYSPGICFTKDPLSSPEKIWELYYNGKWVPGLERKYGLAISAVVKY